MTSSSLGEPKPAEGTKEKTLWPVMEMPSFPLEVVRIRAQGSIQQWAVGHCRVFLQNKGSY